MLRLGVLRPASEWLPAGLRLHASLLRRCPREEEDEEEENCWPWSVGPALQWVLKPEVIQGSSDLQLAARSLLGQLPPLYRQGGRRSAEDTLLSRLACRHEGLAPLRQLPELTAAVQEWLGRRYTRRGGSEEAGGDGAADEEAGTDGDESASWGAGSPAGGRSTADCVLGGRDRADGRGRGRGHISKALGSVSDYELTCAYIKSGKEVLSWWLSGADESAALHRAQVSWL